MSFLEHVRSELASTCLKVNSLSVSKDRNFKESQKVRGKKIKMTKQNKNKNKQTKKNQPNKQKNKWRNFISGLKCIKGWHKRKIKRDKKKIKRGGISE